MKRFLFTYGFLVMLVSACCGQDAAKNYIKQNSSAIDINDNDDYSSLSLLDPAIDKYTIFLTGEQHWTEGNFELRWKMLRYLYIKAHVRVVFVEAPRSFTYLLNYYMSRNDSTGYDETLQYATQGAKERIYYRNLYRFNMSRQPGDRVVLRGLDREYDPYFVSDAVEKLLGKLKDHSALNHAYSMLAKEKKRAWADSLLQEINSHNEIKAQLKENYSELVSILNATTCKDCDPPQLNKKSPKWTAREDLIYRNFLQMLDDYPGQKFYGQFGNNHIYLQPGEKGSPLLNPFASRLNEWEGSPVKGKVCSIFVNYTGAPSLFSKEDRKMLQKNLPSSPFVLLRLNGDNSPFGYVSGYYQYLVVNSYFRSDEISYNKKNDHYGYIKNESYSTSSLSIGYQYGTNHGIEIGSMLLIGATTANTYYSGAGFVFEFDTRQRMNSFRLSLLTGKDPFYFGLSPVYSTDYRHSAFYLRPEAGLKKNIFSLTYSYNAKLYNKAVDGINRQMITLRMFIPYSRN